MSAEDGKEGDDKLLTRAYVDLFSGAVEQVGDRLTRAMALALSPVDLALWSAEQVRAWVSEDLPRRLRARGTSETAVVSPPAQLLGGVLSGLQTAGTDIELRELFANLLASAMDEHTAAHAHPAFADIVRQLVADEARFLRAIGTREPLPVAVDWREAYDTEGLTSATQVFERVHLQASDQITKPSRVAAYLANLERLGLVAIRERVSYGGERHILERSSEFPQGYASVVLTAFGRDFVRSCMPGPLAPSADASAG